MRKCLIILVFAALPLSSCGEEVKSERYYIDHPSEAQEKVTRCDSNGDAGKGCGNAGASIARRANEQFKLDQAKTRANLKNNAIWPTWNGRK